MKKLIDFTKENTFRTINISAADIYYDNIIKKEDVVVKNATDSFNELFENLMPMNLDIIYLNKIGKFEYNEFKNEKFTYDFVNVSFKNPLYLNKANHKVYKKQKTGKDYSSKFIRTELYANGFNLNGFHYVRYKRSPGSAKGGTCLFVKESLFETLNEWTKTGLDEQKDLCLKNITAYEAYKALSLSSLVTTLELNPYNILFVKDCEVNLKNQKVVRVYRKDNLEAEEAIMDIKNNIFDGEGLLDVSVFEQINKQEKGMMLLRNRFFKCCAFNTNLQKWFEDNKITNVSQLNGYTSATDIKDIKLVVSESCLKYLKMCEGGFTKDNVNRWCANVSNKKNVSLFGVVKYDKPTRFFQGRMVETTYQFLNTLHLTKYGDEGTRKFLDHNIEYISLIRDIKNNPEFIRFFLEGPSNNKDTYFKEDVVDENEDVYEIVEEELLNASSYEYKRQLCLKLINYDKNFINVDLFKNFIFDTVICSLAMKLYKGRALVEGTYATLLGNPLEFLNYIILNKKGNPLFDKKNPKSSLEKDEIYCPFFDSNQEIVGSRAPHITMGNVLYAKNVKLDLVDQYFNLSKEIVVVDAINNNIQHRLNGCDYDSDSILLTNNSILVSAAKKHYEEFLVPYLDVKPSNDNKHKDIVAIDDFIANNYVGKIVNLSQLLNSYHWDLYNSKRIQKTKKVYLQICILEALSNMEIDSAKRPFPVSTKDELSRFNKIKKEYGLIRVPAFFQIITNKKMKFGEIQNQNTEEIKYFKTTMDYIWEFVRLDLNYTRTGTVKYADYFLKDYKTYKVPGAKYAQVRRVLKELKEIIDTNSYARKLKKDNARFSVDGYHLYHVDDYDLERKNLIIQIQNAFCKIKNMMRKPKDAKFIIHTISKDSGGFSLPFLFLHIIDTFQNQLGYSLKDLIPDYDNLIGLNTLKEINPTNKYKYLLFGKFYYDIDVEDYLFRSLFFRNEGKFLNFE